MGVPNIISCSQHRRLLLRLLLNGYRPILIGHLRLPFGFKAMQGQLEQLLILKQPLLEDSIRLDSLLNHHRLLLTLLSPRKLIIQR